jgi:hypothetical protein
VSGDRIRSALRRIPRADAMRRVRQLVRAYRWERSGRLGPPPQLIKQRTVRQEARRHSISCLVETGTYLGDMVAAQLSAFSRIYSIELDPHLAEAARARFAPFPHVTILQGDSAKMLPLVLREIDRPCLFWLDGHYSEGITARGDRVTPIVQELEAVLAHPVRGHVLLIDDARLFDGTDDYPTQQEVERILSRHGAWMMECRDDIIRVR